MLNVLLRLLAAISGALLAVAAVYFPIMKFIADVHPDFNSGSDDPGAILRPFLDWSRINSPILIAGAVMGFISILLLRYAVSASSSSRISYPDID